MRAHGAGTHSIFCSSKPNPIHLTLIQARFAQMQNTEMTIEGFPDIQFGENRASYGKLMAELVAVTQNQYIDIEPQHGELGYLERVYRPLLRYSQANPKKLLKENFPDIEVLREFLSIEEENIPSDLLLIYICTTLAIEALQAHNAKENFLSLELLVNAYYWCGFQNCIDKHDAIMAETLIKENNSEQGLKKALTRHKPNIQTREQACKLARELGPWKNYPAAAEIIYEKLKIELDEKLGSEEPIGLLISWFQRMPDRMDVFEMARTPPSPKKKK
jgi:hypothetical protein